MIKTYSTKSVCDRLIKKYGACITDMTMYQLQCITKFINNGWEACGGFYGDKNTNSDLAILKPNFSWFKFIGVPKAYAEKCTNANDKMKNMSGYVFNEDDVFGYAACVNFVNDEVTVYNYKSPEKTYQCAKFSSCDDMFNVLLSANEFVPVYPIVVEEDPNVYSAKIAESDRANMRGHISNQLEKVFHHTTKLKYKIDYDKLLNITRIGDTDGNSDFDDYLCSEKQSE